MFKRPNIPIPQEQKGDENKNIDQDKTIVATNCKCGRRFTNISAALLSVVVADIRFETTETPMIHRRGP